MEIILKETSCIITPLSPKLDKYQSDRLLKKVLNETKKIALNLDYVTDCTIEFIEEIKDFAKNNEISFFNINSDIFSIFNFMGLDKIVKIYVSEHDFKTEARRLLRRDFKLV